MRITEHLYFYVEVTFGNSARRYSYICNDLRVKVGDTVEVPAGNNQQIKATVVSTLFCTAEEAPYPVEKTKTVIGWASNTFSQSSAENGLVPTAEKNSIIPSESVSAACSITPQEASVSQTDSIAKSTADNTEKKSVTADSDIFHDILDKFFISCWIFAIVAFINLIILNIINLQFDYLVKSDVYVSPLVHFGIPVGVPILVIILLNTKPKFININKSDNTKKAIWVQPIIALIVVVSVFVSYGIICSKINAKEEAEYKATHSSDYSTKSKSKSSKTTTYRTSGNNNSSGIRKSSGKKKSSDSDDKYNADDYSHPDDFYYDHYDDFFDYEEAEDYWKEHHDD